MLLERKVWQYAAILLTGAVVLAGCGKDSAAHSQEKPHETTTSTAPTTTAAAEIDQPAIISKLSLTFDYLNGNNKIINVYPGVSDSPADKTPNGAFNDGESVPAICKTEGRLVTSVPPEIPRQSNEWIEIVGSPGLEQFATAVYVQDPDTLLAQLPDC